MRSGAAVISELWTALRAADPGVTALTDGHHAVDYGTLVSCIAREIDWLGAGRDERYALLADNGVGWAMADLALHLGERPSVPLPPAFTPQQRRHALDDAGVDTVLTDDPAAAVNWLPGWIADGRAPASGFYRWRRTVTSKARPVLPVGTRKITYTSGSTATPKGVCLAGPTLEATASALAAAVAALPITRHLCVLPLATLLENVAGLYAPLLRGATVAVPSCADTGMTGAGVDVPRLLQAVAAQRPDTLILVPELLQALTLAAERGWPVPESLQFVAVGGARVSPSLLQRAMAVGIPAYEGYGLSECGSVVCLNTPAARRPGAVGRALPHVRVRIDDDGAIHVAGSAMLGYLGEAPVSRGEIATGDLGEFDADGFLRLRGRAGDRFITSYGRNVSPEWIESEVSQRLAGRPVLAFGEARPFVVALIDAGPEFEDVAIDGAIAAANATLPAYAQVRRWARVPGTFAYAAGTLTANGRLRRAEIHGRCAGVLDNLYAEALAS